MQLLKPPKNAGACMVNYMARIWLINDIITRCLEDVMGNVMLQSMFWDMLSKNDIFWTSLCHRKLCSMWRNIMWTYQPSILGQMVAKVLKITDKKVGKGHQKVRRKWRTTWQTDIEPTSLGPTLGIDTGPMLAGLYRVYIMLSGYRMN